MLLIPVLDTPAHRYRIAIEGTEYTLRFTYNTRASSWYLDIGDGVGTWIARGIRIVQGWPLLARMQDERLPPGDLFMFFSPTESDALGRDGFVDGARFYYWTAAELEDLGFTPETYITLETLELVP